MSFDLRKMTEFCLAEINKFAAAHADETFYAFAVDADLLCLNSEEAAAESLRRYRADWENEHRPISSLSELSCGERKDADYLLKLNVRRHGLDLNDEAACVAVINEFRAAQRAEGNQYETPEGIRGLREDTGAWSYQGFARMSGEQGFDTAAYDKHYNLDDDKQKNSAYARAMDELVERLKREGAFDNLRRTPDFQAGRVEHNY